MLYKYIQKKASLAAIILLALAGVTPSTWAAGMEISVRVGNSDTDTDGIYYAFDNAANTYQEGDLGDGNIFRLDFAMDLPNGHTVGVGYGQNTLSGDDTYDTNPAATNDCNVEPLQGLYDDCFDHANVDIDTDISVFDVSYGMKFGMGNMSLTPYAGIRYLTFNQETSVDYIFPGGNESFPERELDYTGFGLRVGSGLKVPFGSSPFYFKGNLALAKMLSGDRDQKMTDVVTGGPVAPLPYEESDDIDPLTIDLELSFGYDITPTMNAGIGYGYHKISDIMDTRDTTNQIIPGTISGAHGVGDDNEDLVTSAIFAEFAYKF